MVGTCIAATSSIQRQTPAPAAAAPGRVRAARQLLPAPRCSSVSTAGPYDSAASRSGSSRGSSLAAASAATSTATATSAGSRVASPSSSGSSNAVASSSCRVRPADAADYWALADLHCSAFYPRAPPFWFSALRVDRVMAVQLGTERQERGNFICLVADSLHSSSSASSSSSAAAAAASRARRSSSSSAGGVAWNESAAAGGRRSSVGSPEAALGMVPAGVRVDLGPLADFIVSAVMPPSMKQNYAATYAAGGLRGAVVLDTLGMHLPPKQALTPSGFMGEAPRTGIAYLSNLAVAPCSRREGIGRKLLREAELVAASWGCRSIALHVDPANTAAVEMYRSAGYRRVMGQPEWQRVLEGRATPLALMMRALPWEDRQRAKLQGMAAAAAAAAAAATAAAAAAEEQAAAGQ